MKLGFISLYSQKLPTAPCPLPHLHPAIKNTQTTPCLSCPPLSGMEEEKPSNNSCMTGRLVGYA
nr:MAG TPA: hypothetical protein [Caudoviricetes sp.]